MVLGAKGSPLQLILSAVFHIDAPTGNIPYEEAKKWMHHPFVEKAIPLAYGDSYKGKSIVGSDSSLLTHYAAQVSRGRIFTNNFEVVVGSNLAASLQLSVGSKFFSTHGEGEHGEEHKDHPYTVVGVLAPTGAVIDNLIVSNIESVWEIHEHGDHHHEHNDQEHASDTEHAHEQDHEQNHEHEEHAAAHSSHSHESDTATGHEAHDRELTAVLIKFRNPMGIVQLPRTINKNSNLMSALPAIEMNRMFSLLGLGVSVLTYIGAGIMLLSAFSIFVALFNSLKERKYEIALLRVTGTSRTKIILLLLSEAFLLSISAVVSGILLSRILLLLISGYLTDDYHLSANFYKWLLPKEIYMIAAAIAITLLAALVPALKAGRINISKTLANG